MPNCVYSTTPKNTKKTKNIWVWFWVRGPPANKAPSDKKKGRCHLLAFMYESGTSGKTESALRSVSITGKYRGYWYLLYGVDLVMSDPELLLCVTKRLYQNIAKCFDTSPGAVERCIRLAIIGAWERCNREVLAGLMGFMPTRCPSNVQFIESLAHHIRTQTAEAKS